MTKARKAVGDKVILDDVTHVLLPRRQDRRGRPERRRQVHHPQDHGRAGPALQRRGPARRPGYTVGILLQEPPLNEDKTVLGNVEEGARRDQGEARPLQRDLRARWPSRTPTSTRCWRRWASSRRPSTPPTPGTSTPSSSRPWTPCAARRRTPTSPCSPVVSAAASRCASCCCRSRTCCCSTSPPTTSTPSACCGSSSTSPATPAPSSPSPTTGTSSTTSPSGSPRSTAAALYPYEGNYSTYLEKKRARLEVQGKKDAKLAKRLTEELEWVRSNAKGRQTKSKARLARYEEMAAEADRTRKLDFEEIQIPPGPRLGATVIEAKNLQKGFGDRVLIDGPVLHAAAQRHRRRHRPQRRRQDHAVQDHRRARGAARRRRP